MNTINIIGNMGQDPEMKFFESGSCVCNFSLAVKIYNFKTKENDTHWLDFKAWNKLADTITEYAKKGCRLGIMGHLETETWTGNDNKKHKKVIIIAERVDFLSPKEISEQKGTNAERYGEEEIVQFDTIGDDEIPF